MAYTIGMVFVNSDDLPEENRRDPGTQWVVGTQSLVKGITDCFPEEPHSHSIEIYNQPPDYPVAGDDIPQAAVYLIDIHGKKPLSGTISDLFLKFRHPKGPFLIALFSSRERYLERPEWWSQWLDTHTVDMVLQSVDPNSPGGPLNDLGDYEKGVIRKRLFIGIH